jgi:hypothetical protein
MIMSSCFQSHPLKNEIFDTEVKDKNTINSLKKMINETRTWVGATARSSNGSSKRLDSRQFPTRFSWDDRNEPNEYWWSSR